MHYFNFFCPFAMVLFDQRHHPGSWKTKTQLCASLHLTAVCFVLHSERQVTIDSYV